jgi:hypothetical protein
MSSNTRPGAINQTGWMEYTRAAATLKLFY